MTPTPPNLEIVNRVITVLLCCLIYMLSEQVGMLGMSYGLRVFFFASTAILATVSLFTIYLHFRKKK